MNADPAIQFDQVAKNYATSAVHANGPDLQWLVEALDLRPEWRVLDLGTGAGHAAMAVAPHVVHVDSVDVASTMLATATQLAERRNLTNIAFVRADVAALPWSGPEFDAAFTRFSAHHWSDIPAALQDVARVLKPGAPLVIIDTVSLEHPAIDTYINCLELLRDPSHARNLRLSEWAQALTQAGFLLESTRQWLLELETDSWLSRAATTPWRAKACRHLLSEAGSAVRDALPIKEDVSSFNLPTALIQARRL